MQRARPEDYQPQLTLWSHVWRSVLALAISVLAFGSTAPAQWRDARPLFWLDLGLGLLCFVLMFWRRRHPMGIALISTLAGVASVSSAGPGLLIVVSLATRRRVREIAVVAVLGIVTTQIFYAYQPMDTQNAWLVNLVFAVIFTVAAVSAGMYIGSRRELLWTLRDRAHRAESEQALRVRQARDAERARIAREMHDVLAHRISLVSMHAGALAYRDDLTPDQVRESAEVIQSKAHEALTDLRQVLGVLRGEDAELAHRPQPTFADVPALVDEAQAAGMRVRYAEHLDDASAMPEHVGRTVYNVVQEGLTNARKHAPGTEVTVRVTGDPVGGVEVAVRNRTLLGHVTTTPGAGLGLVGLAERVGLAGGTLEHTHGQDAFTLRARLPWPARPDDQPPPAPDPTPGQAIAR